MPWIKSKKSLENRTEMKERLAGIYETSRFTEYFAGVNQLDREGFREWFFEAGMRFGAIEKWWGDLGRRKSPHEGLDLCLYKDGRNEVRRVEPGAGVPAMFSGRVAGIIPDFLGESIILEHETPDCPAGKFCTFYAHVQRCPGIEPGKKVDQGDVVARIAGVRRSGSGIFPHLHVSAAWVVRGMLYEDLTWTTMGRRPDVKLVDPLPLFHV
jgi:murein DD-endopeptidase MepM/ murein hydrolase activator NlpD